MAATPPDEDDEGGEEEFAPPAHGPGDVLPYRLERKSSWGAQAGCATVIGLFLTALGSVFIYFEVRADDVGLGTVVGGGFALVGLLVLGLGGIHQLWARAQTAETFFEIEALRIARGEPVRFCVVQPGPADFQSLRVKVICQRTVITWKNRNGKREADRDIRIVHDHCALDMTDIAVARGARRSQEGALLVPLDQPPSGGAGTPESPAHEWQIEIWGRVRRGPDVMHPYVIHVD